MKAEFVKLLIPFSVIQLLYWNAFHEPSYFWSVGDNPGLVISVIKTLPVSSLAFYLGTSKSKNPLVQRLFWGTIFSAIGDFCLVFPNLFLSGMVFFLVAQVSFIRAFSFKPLKPMIGITLAFVMTPVITRMILPNIEDFDFEFKFGVPIYSLFLGIMVWRALARVHRGFIEKLTGIGAMLFLISDGCIGINKFYAKMPYAQEIILSTYYGAQFLISLSACKVIDGKKGVK